MPSNKESPLNKSGGVPKKQLSPQKSASFHGRLPAEHRTLRRPKTQPDLLRPPGSATPTPARETATAAPPFSPNSARRVPSKVLVNVMVERSLGPVQVVASTDWTVDELVAAVLQNYSKEGRRPLLPRSPVEASAFSLHYSQFSLEGLDPGEMLIRLGSRNFFLRLKPTNSAPEEEEKTCSKEAATEEKKASKLGGAVASLPWLRFMDFLL